MFCKVEKVEKVKNKMLTDKQILKLYNDPKFGGSYSGIRVFRDFLFTEKQELIPEKRLFDLLKTDKNYLLHMRPGISKSPFLFLYSFFFK